MCMRICRGACVTAVGLNSYAVIIMQTCHADLLCTVVHTYNVCAISYLLTVRYYNHRISQTNLIIINCSLYELDVLASVIKSIYSLFL